LLKKLGILNGSLGFFVFGAVHLKVGRAIKGMSNFLSTLAEGWVKTFAKQREGSSFLFLNTNHRKKQ
jgi:hypothetical protein